MKRKELNVNMSRTLYLNDEAEKIYKKAVEVLKEDTGLDKMTSSQVVSLLIKRGISLDDNSEPG